MCLFFRTGPGHGLHLALVGLILAGSALLQSGAAQAAEVVGTTDLVANRVVGQLARDRRTLVRQDPVYVDETVYTEVKASARFVFNDSSDLRLGPNARIRLGTFVYGGSRGTSLELTRGALRFLSGSGPKGSYQIRTPVATIGLRGTGVGIVTSARRTYVTLLHGAVQVCSRSGQCQTLSDACTYVAVDRSGVSDPEPLRPGTPSFASTCIGPVCGANSCSTANNGLDPARGLSGGAGGPGGGGSGGRS
jgi:outer membrane immunogenic protein